jgi:protein-L-isoaspartate(D-aspartate) O-methyltransferase
MDTSIEQARFNMIQQQIRPWNLHDDRVLEVMDAVPRERFVPDAYRSLAYADIEIPIGAGGQAMLSPKVVGRMLQALDIKGEDRILEIGTGTGYVTACLARLGRQVVSLEIDPELAAQALETLGALEVRRLDLRVGDALAGPVEGNPFDVIAVTGSLPDDEALSALQAQLALGGRLFAILGEEPVMEAVLVTRIAANGFSRKGLFETCVPTLVKVPEPERFVF